MGLPPHPPVMYQRHRTRTKKAWRKRGETLHENQKKLKNKKIDSLMEAFCYVSVEEATTVYREAGGDLNKPAEILSDLVDHDDDPSTVSVASGSSGQETGSTFEYGAGSSSSCGEELTRERWLKGSKLCVFLSLWNWFDLKPQRRLVYWVSSDMPAVPSNVPAAVHCKLSAKS